MAKRRVEARTVTVCDVCGRQEGYLQTCIACGREFCLICDTTIVGAGVSPDVCRGCPQMEQVQALCDRYAPKLAKLVKARDAEIAALRPLKSKAVRKAR